jgi:hypothetical protein
MSPAFDVEVKLSSELASAERAQFCSLFGEVFHRPFPEDLFVRKYLQAHTGNSFHSLAWRDGIAGAFSAVLFRYSFFGRECTFATAIDLMLDRRFRPATALMRRMSEALYARLADAGVAFVFSCVREEMMRFHQVLGGWRNIGSLSYYALPVCAPRFPGSAGLLRSLIRTGNTIKRAGAAGDYPIAKIDDAAFRSYRYSYFETEYRSVSVDGGAAVYTGRMFWPLPGAPEDLHLSMLVDVWPLQPEVFDGLTREIVRKDRSIDYLIYPGCLPFQPRSLWRVPRRLERPRYFLGGRVLRPDLIDARVYDLSNWRINLSDTDLV